MLVYLFILVRFFLMVFFVERSLSLYLVIMNVVMWIYVRVYGIRTSWLC